MRSGTELTISALVLPRITAYVGGNEARENAWPHLQGLELADPDYQSRDPVDILLGADVYAFILQPDLRKGGGREPVAQSTSLGWILSGAVGRAESGSSTSTYQCQVSEDLVAAVKKFWDQEEILPRMPRFSKKIETVRSTSARPTLEGQMGAI